MRVRRATRSVLLALGLLAVARVAAAASPGVRADSSAHPGTFPLIAILCYHDVSSDSTGPLQTVPPEFLREQIRACKAGGWTFLSLTELLARREHPQQLPPRVMVLTFDDGYRSFAERALPILRAERIRPTLAIITSFVDRPPAGLPPLLTWGEIRSLDASGAAEIASHSHALHRYETSNPYADTGPSVSVRRYLPAETRYEDREEYRGRVGDDLVESERVLRERLGHATSVLVWPYGVHNEMARGLAERAGFSATLALGWRPVTAADLRSGCLPRIMVTRRLSFGANAESWLHPPHAPVLAAQVDLDALWDPDEAVFRARLDQVVTRARALGATTVILPVCPGPNGEGRLSRAYAMNHQLPVLADVWSMAAAKFAAARMRVWVRAPAMNLTWVWVQHPEWRVRAGEGGGMVHWGTRLSPDLAGVRGAAADFFTDLAVYLPIDGVLFDDDAVLRAGDRLAADREGGSADKSAAIRGLLEACKSAVRAWRPECRFATCVPAEIVGHAGVDPRFGRDFADALTNDDITFVAPDSPANARDRFTAADVGRLARRAVSACREDRAHGGDGEPPVLLLLPAYDAHAQDWFPAAVQQAMTAAAKRSGMFHLGTGPIAAEGPLPVGLLDAGEPEPSGRRDTGGY